MMGTPQTLVTAITVVLALVPTPSMDDLAMKCFPYSNRTPVLADWQAAPFSEVPFSERGGKDDSFPALRHTLLAAS